MPLRIMTYNAHSCVGMDGQLSHLRIAEVIAAYDPDVVALQELDLARPRSGGIDQAARIAERLEMHFHFHPALRIAEEHYGDALLSKWPLRLIKAGPLPMPPRRLLPMESRGAIWVAIPFGEGELQIVTTHLGLLRRERWLQTDALLGSDWMGHPDCRRPTVLCGDLNSLPSSRVYRKLAASLRDAQRSRQARAPYLSTFPSRWPFLTLDYLFVTDDLEVRALEVPRTELTGRASDHLPIVADLG
jgi:endonuclease/exonuclease/phosphatase family metal-dependent hydrolase